MHSATIKSYSLTSWILVLLTIIQVSKFVNVHNDVEAQKIIFETGANRLLQEEILNRKISFRNYVNTTTKPFKFIHTQLNQTNFNIFKLWQSFPVNFLIPQPIGDVKLSSMCEKQSEVLKNGINLNEMWALTMFDASAKLPAGILSGNVNQLGDFDECLSIQKSSIFTNETIFGKYCLANIEIKLTHGSDFIKNVNSRIHGKYLLTSNLHDYGHRVPRFSSFNWGVCVPSGCSANDLETLIYAKLKESLPPQNVEIGVHINEQMCSSKTPRKMEESTSGYNLTRGFFLVLLFVTVIGSCGLFPKTEDTKNSKLTEILNCFSIQTNWSNLIRIETNSDGINGVHGLRFLNAVALLLVHKSMGLLYNPYINRAAMAESFGQPWSMVGRSAILYTDSFIFLSGLLNANAFLNEYKLTGQIKFAKRIVNRLFRIIPNFAVLIFFCTYFLPSLGSGPLWPQVITVHSEICKTNMWRSFLMIHNYFGFENMCLTHTHQVGMDTQLFILCPIFIYFLVKNWKRGICLLGGAMVGSTLLRAWAAYYYNLGPVVYNGMKLKQFFDTANFSYILPTHRLTIYLVGVLFAFMLHQKMLPKFTQFQVRLFWTISTISGVGIVFAPLPMSNINYIYSPIQAALYNAVSPWFWGLFLFWGAVAVNTNNAGWFGDFLCWRPFQIFSKIAYSFYLTQFPIFFFNIGQRRYSEKFKSHLLFEPDEVGCIVVCSVILTLLVEMPFINLHRVLFGSPTKISPKFEVQKED